MRLALAALFALATLTPGCAEETCTGLLTTMLTLTVFEDGGSAVVPDRLEMIGPDGAVSDVTAFCGERSDGAGRPHCVVPESGAPGLYRFSVTHQDATAAFEATWDGDEYGCDLEHQELLVRLPAP